MVKATPSSFAQRISALEDESRTTKTTKIKAKVLFKKKIIQNFFLPNSKKSSKK